jgi:hypothetical protein
MKYSPYTRDVADAEQALLSPEEARIRLAKAMRELDEGELENLAELIDWFRRRYPTPLDRFRYLRRKTAEIVRRSGG